MIGAEALLKVKAAMVGHSRYPLSYIQAMMRPPDRRLQYRWSVVDLPRPTTLEVEEMREAGQVAVSTSAARGQAGEEVGPREVGGCIHRVVLPMYQRDRCRPCHASALSMARCVRLCICGTCAVDHDACDSSEAVLVCVTCAVPVVPAIRMLLDLAPLHPVINQHHTNFLYIQGLNVLEPSSISYWEL
jgi:hypothetical protein